MTFYIIHSVQMVYFKYLYWHMYWPLLCVLQISLLTYVLTTSVCITNIFSGICTDHFCVYYKYLYWHMYWPLLCVLQISLLTNCTDHFCVYYKYLYWHMYWPLLYCNLLVCVMISVLFSSAVDRGFEPRQFLRGRSTTIIHLYPVSVLTDFVYYTSILWHIIDVFQSHFSVNKAAMLLGIGHDNVIAIDCDAR
jgi:uncharacterized integral membrane protein